MKITSAIKADKSYVDSTRTEPVVESLPFESLNKDKTTSIVKDGIAKHKENNEQISVKEAQSLLNQSNSISMEIP